MCRAYSSFAASCRGSRPLRLKRATAGHSDARTGRRARFVLLQLSIMLFIDVALLGKPN
jgi:hypothetical protein